MNEAPVDFRPIDSRDQAFLTEMLYLAFFVPEGATPFPRSILDRPDILKYHKGYGKKGDYGFLALAGQEAIGAIWCRIHHEDDPGYGFIRSDIPELNLALLPEARGHGIGQKLMAQLEEKLQLEGVAGLSLSVDQRNTIAYHIYRKLGYQIVKEEGTAITMLKLF
ncbi:MAG: GNAT family N-acetyltransferase [Saprospiraceae bacterium]|nr:GNAT family N-acetyltransferase [Saprospiraceae bacterium]